MSHLDEGTIHAWLDGELDAERARAVESHAASCAQCSALVAEARGLVAGASRILNALDEVPAGVLPKGTPAWSARKAPQPPRRQWRAAPWVTGIAAALILTVGITTWRRNPDVPLSDNMPIRTRTVTVFDSTVAAATAQREAAAAELRSAAGTRASQPRTPAARPEPSSVRSRVAVAPRSDRGTGGAGGAGAAGAAGVASGDLAGAKVAAAPAPAASAAVSDASKKADALPLPTAALAPPAPEKAVVMMKDAPSDAERAHAFEVAPAGCYPIPPESTRRTVSEAVGQAGATRSRAPTTAAPQPARALAREDVLPPVPTRVQLDTTPASPGYAVRAVSTGARLGFWRRAGDSLRVELLVAGAYTLPITSRIPCPTDP